MKTSRILAAALLVVGSGLALQAAKAQQAGLHRTDLLQHDLGQPGRETVQVRVDFDPGAVSIKHSHPGEEVAYVLEGSLEYQLEGRAPVTLHAGDALFIPAGRLISRKRRQRQGIGARDIYRRKGSPLVVPVK